MAVQAVCRGGRFAVESMAAFAWNGWVLSYLLILPASFVLMIFEGTLLDPAILVNSWGSTVFILGYNVTVLLAYKQVDANQVTSAEYTGLIWAVAIGWIRFIKSLTCGFWSAA